MLRILWNDDEFVCACWNLVYSWWLIRMRVSQSAQSNGGMIVVKTGKDLSANDDDECNYATDYKGSVLAQLLQVGEERTL